MAGVPRVLVLGGGFGGATVARQLSHAARRGQIELTLLSRSPAFLFTPLLHEVATGSLTAESVAVPLRRFLPAKAMRVLVGEATSVDREQKIVRASCAEGCVLELPYDYLVIALGSRPNFFGTVGAPELALPLKSLEDAGHIRAAILAAFERATRERRAPLFSIVGAGPTGVELAAELADLCARTLEPEYPEVEPAAIALLSAGNEILPALSPKGRAKALAVLESSGVTVMLGAKVAEVESRGVRLADGSRLDADAVFWSAGVSPSPFPAGAGLILDASGRAIVDGSLRAEGAPEIYVLGDQAAGAPMLAQAATQQAEAVAASVLSAAGGRAPRLFRFRSKGMMVSLGRWRAVGQIGGFTVSGPLAWLLWRTIYLLKFPSFWKRARVGAEWAIGLFFPRDISA